MDWFKIVVESLVAVSVALSVAAVYMSSNKVWKRKHERSVTESISVSENLLGILVTSPMFIKFAIVDINILPAIAIFIIIASMILFVLIGSGLWVRDGRKTGFFRKLLSTLKLEAKDSGHLIKSFLRPQSAGQVLKILVDLARVDSEIAKEEVKLIEEFARQWNLKTPDLTVGKVDEEISLSELRETTIKYLDTRPPVKQAAQLLDMLKLIVYADDKVSEEEDIIFKELSGLIANYKSRDDYTPRQYEVLLVPQNEEQIKAVQSLFPTKTLEDRRSGQVLSVGTFYSKEYAETVSQQYIDMKITSVWSAA